MGIHYLQGERPAVDPKVTVAQLVRGGHLKTAISLPPKRTSGILLKILVAGDGFLEPFDKDGKVAEFFLKMGEDSFGVRDLGELFFEASKLSGLIKHPCLFQEGLRISDLFEPLCLRW